MYKIRLECSGVLPDTLCLGLIHHDALLGSLTKSSTNFKPYGLESIDVLVNSQSINYFPLQRNSKNFSEFYHRFLKVSLLAENIV